MISEQTGLVRERGHMDWSHVIECVVVLRRQIALVGTRKDLTTETEGWELRPSQKARCSHQLPVIILHILILIK